MLNRDKLIEILQTADENITVMGVIFYADGFTLFNNNGTLFQLAVAAQAFSYETQKIIQHTKVNPA